MSLFLRFVYFADMANETFRYRFENNYAKNHQLNRTVGWKKGKLQFLELIQVHRAYSSQFPHFYVIGDSNIFITLDWRP